YATHAAPKCCSVKDDHKCLQDMEKWANRSAAYEFWSVSGQKAPFLGNQRGVCIAQHLPRNVAQKPADNRWVACVQVQPNHPWLIILPSYLGPRRIVMTTAVRDEQSDSAAGPPVIQPGHTFATVTDQIGAIVLTRPTSRRWWFGFVFAFLLLMVLQF